MKKALSGTFENYLFEVKDLINQPDFNIGYVSHLIKPDDYLPLLEHMDATLFVIDFRESIFTYISNNCERISGYTKDELNKMGVFNYLMLVHENDQVAILNKIFPKGMEVTRAHKDIDLSKLKISYNYRLKQKDGSYRMLLQNFSYLLADDEFNPLVIMGTTMDVSHILKDTHVNCRMHLLDENENWKIIYEETYLTEETPEDYKITATEMDVLKALAIGKTSKEIALEKGKSFETVYKQRKNLLEKLSVSNTLEAVSFAQKNGWLN